MSPSPASRPRWRARPCTPSAAFPSRFVARRLWRAQARTPPRLLGAGLFDTFGLILMAAVVSNEESRKGRLGAGRTLFERRVRFTRRTLLPLGVLPAAVLHL